MRYGKNKKCLMFVDETGDTNIEDDSIFGLTGVIFKSNSITDKDSSFYKRLNSLKLDCFNDETITLHLNDIIRKTKNFKDYKIEDLQKFIDNLPLFLQNTEMDIISVTINKDNLKDHKDLVKDVYEIAFAHLLESYYIYIKKYNIESAKIILESRDEASNFIVQNTFFKVFNNGTTYYNIDDSVKNKIKGFIISPKGDKDYGAGLEIADLLCNPLSRLRGGKHTELSRGVVKHRKNTIYRSIEEKIFNINGDIYNWGFRYIPVRDYLEVNGEILKKVAATNYNN